MNCIVKIKYLLLIIILIIVIIIILQNNRNIAMLMSLNFVTKPFRGHNDCHQWVKGFPVFINVASVIIRCTETQPFCIINSHCETKKTNT